MVFDVCTDNLVYVVQGVAYYIDSIECIRSVAAGPFGATCDIALSRNYGNLFAPSAVGYDGYVAESLDFAERNEIPARKIVCVVDVDGAVEIRSAIVPIAH